MDDPSAPSEAAVRVLHEEARDHLEAVVAAIQDMDDKTSSLVRFNAVIVGVVTTGVSVGLRAHGTLAGLEAVVVSLTVGLVAMVVSTVEGVRSYLKPDTEVGIDPEQLEEALDSSASEVDVRAEAVRVYRTGVE